MAQGLTGPSPKIPAGFPVGFYGDTTDPTTFYQVAVQADGSTTVAAFTCPEGTVFDARLGTPNYRDEADTSYLGNPADTTTPIPPATL
jgi:hypothetical protein